MEVYVNFYRERQLSFKHLMFELPPNMMELKLTIFCLWLTIANWTRQAIPNLVQQPNLYAEVELKPQQYNICHIDMMQGSGGTTSIWVLGNRLASLGGKCKSTTFTISLQVSNNFPMAQSQLPRTHILVAVVTFSKAVKYLLPPVICNP